MEFKSDLKKFSLQVSQRKAHIINEEMTKQALIIPFLQILGFDVFNPLEVRPEYISDFGIKKGEKVDYAIFKDGHPIFFIEAKSVTEKLHKHDSQLSRYFNCTPDVKIGVLTNGIEYKFFTDLTQDNIMDSNPFFTFNIEALSNIDIETIENFTKEKFDVNNIVNFAEELVYMNNLNSTLKGLFKNPSDDFLRFLIKDFSNTRITTNVLDRFRPIVKKAISNTLLEIISEGLSQKEFSPEPVQNIEKEEENTVNKEQETEKEETAVKRKGVNTTEEEMKAYEIVKEILNKYSRDTSQVLYKDTTNYFGIYKRAITSWIIRTSLDSNQKGIITRLPVDVVLDICPGFTVIEAPKSLGSSKVLINSLSDLKNMEKLIVRAFDEADNK